MSNTSLPFRASLLLFLMLCLLISCPIKQELKSVFQKGIPVESNGSSQPQPKNTSGNIAATSYAVACTKAVHSILDEVETNSLFQKFDFKNPVLFLAISLAGLYLLLIAGAGKTNCHYAYPGNILAAKIPLFLRYQRLVI